ncbi:MAG TPA: DUF5685 family protein [Clostridiales bacterium]|nr:DUF5685 family protein [Clostridiales bacterium]
MFGYIMPDKPELKIKEYEAFNAFYCGVCKSIGRRYGNIPRLILNYDSAFLAILLWSLEDKNLEVNRERCIVHPIKKRLLVIKNDIIDYSADINIILSYFNLEDNKRDEGSIIAKTGTVILKPIYKKLRRKYRKKCDIIEQRLEELATLEKNMCTSMDMAAEPFARIMEEVIAYNPLCKDENVEKIIRWLGYNLGKWIYLLDAFDDMEDDAKKNRYNPFLHKKDLKKEEISELKNRIRSRVEFNLIYSLDQIGKAYELLHAKNVRGLIENIIYLGMYKKTEKILGVGRCKEVESI